MSMNIRVYAPNQIQNQLQLLANESVEKLRTFFERIKSAEVTFSGEGEKTVEMKVFLMRRVLYVTDRAEAYEEALESVLAKMRSLLMVYKKEVAIY